MEENNISVEETAAATEGADQTNVYDGWDEEHAETDAAPEPEAKPEEEKPAEGPEPEQEGEKNPEEEMYLTLKHLETTRTVTREEAQALAQKGLDYDRVKGKLEELREYQKGVGPAVAMIQRYAEQNHMTMEEYLDFCRSQELMQSGMTEDQAKQQIALERRETAVSAKEAEADAREQARTDAENEAATQEEQVRKDIQAFMRDFPGVDAKEIPEEVWADMMQNKTSMSVAYGKWKIKALEREAEAAKAAAEAKAKTTGSLTGSLPASSAADPAFEGWED